MARPIKNNMDYFPHDNKMRNDRKIKALRAKYGLEGYAVYNMLLETLCEAELLIIQWDESEIELVSGDLTIVSDKLTDITEYLCKIKLLNKVNGWLFCKELDNRSEAVFGKRTRDLNSLRSDNDINITETSVSVTESTQSKVKESKVNKSKEIHCQLFENFRQKYPGTKRGIETEFEYFKKHKDWKSIIESLPEIIDKQIAYRSVRKNRGEFVPEWKNLKTWIYNRCWEEEIEEVKPKSRFQE